MSDINFQWAYEEFPVRIQTCEGCGDKHRVASGVVYNDEGEELAMYIAHLLAHEGVRQVALYIGMVVQAPKNRELKARRRNRRRRGNSAPKDRELKWEFVCLMLQMREGKVVTSVYTDPNDPLGVKLTREEALKSPFISLVYEVDDFILEADSRIHPFLEDGSEVGVPENT